LATQNTALVAIVKPLSALIARADANGVDIVETMERNMGALITTGADA
jgi:hypothetical protein